MIAGIVLAAGRSRRMGRPKAFLRLGDATFLELAVGALRDGGCDPVVVVTGPAGDAAAGETADAARRLGARTVVNPEPASEQADSLAVALRALSADAEAAVVTPVDVPRVSGETVRRMIEAHRSTGAPVVQPYDGERHGHPVLFARSLFPELLARPLPDGARSVIHAHASGRAEVMVTTLAADVDTPDDYRRLVEARG